MFGISCSIVLTIYLGLSSISDVANGQELPEVPCPQYFQYVACETSICGLITLPSIKTNTLIIRAEFSIPQYIQVADWGKLSPLLDKDTTADNVRNGVPVSYRVDFPRSNRFPKLTSLRINDQEINACLSAKYQAPKADFHLEHALLSPNSLQNIDSLPNINNLNNLNRPFMTNVPKPPIVNIYDASNSRDPLSNDVTSNIPNSFVNRGQPQRPTFMQQPQINQQPTTEFVAQTTARTRRPVVQQQSTSLVPSPPRKNINTITRNNITNTRNNNGNRRIDYSECGVEGTEGLLPFIHEGTILTKGQFPWLATIYRKEINSINLTCGGSLISPRSVLTAAHCFRINRLTPNQMLVYLGRYDLENYNEEGVQIHEVQTLLGHPDYSTISLPDADIALLQLKRTVEYSLYVRPVCLWTESDDLELIIGAKATIAGWGADEAGNLVSPLPKMANSTIVSQSICAESSPIFKQHLSPRSLCAGDRDGSGPCKGDSGGSLMIKRNNRWTVRGIVVAGRTIHQSCDLRHFVVYCDVAKHLEWVLQNMSN